MIDELFSVAETLLRIPRLREEPTHVADVLRLLEERTVTAEPEERKRARSLAAQLCAAYERASHRPGIAPLPTLQLARNII